MTDNDIIKAKELIKKLEEAYNFYYDVSRGMPYDIDTTIRETAICLEHCVDLILRQKAEIEEKSNKLRDVLPIVAELKAETITEFAERLKARMNDVSRVEYSCKPYFLVSTDFIDQIAKEMKEGVNK